MVSQLRPDCDIVSNNHTIPKYRYLLTQELKSGLKLSEIPSMAFKNLIILTIFFTDKVISKIKVNNKLRTSMPKKNDQEQSYAIFTT